MSNGTVTRQEDISHDGLSGPAWFALILLISWLVLPLIPLGIWSISRSWFFPDITPSAYSLRAWTYVFSTTSEVLPALGMTTFIALCATLLSAIIGLPAGRALGLYQFRGKAVIELLILAPTIVPGIAVALGLHVVFLNLGLAGSFSGVLIIHLIPTLPYMVLVMAGVFANYNPEIEAQARSLGAGPIQTFYYVTLPAILPGLLIGSLFTFLVSWSQYILTLLIGGGRVVTLPLLLFNFASAGRNDITGAISMIYILPGVVLLLLGARHLTGRNSATESLRQI
ncbi:ABC transporter permease [Sneathiella sp. HT1-7]|jgi:putative spermidine/putrescine transport system permease protein|uniref:ABC transporter permease n=1 Tax=Sneathiella sp. HT1-7 TaxID=2887192 RepID=UPI001D14B2DD|nr:ABC transporter permease [Sneathiella sp. HT1-7]MCC3303591.1 ABC transporter permease [Sneathiella sp. HT1-7]